MDELMISMTNRWKSLLLLFIWLCVYILYSSFTEPIIAWVLMIVSSKQSVLLCEKKLQISFPLPYPKWQSSARTWNYTQRCRATKGPARTSCFYNYDVLNGALEEKTYNRLLGMSFLFEEALPGLLSRITKTFLPDPLGQWLNGRSARVPSRHNMYRYSYHIT